MVGTTPLAGSSRIRFRALAVVAVLAMLLGLAPLASNVQPAFAGPVADSPETYLLCGRVFPDPQAYWANGLGEDTPYPGVGSPFAKGNAACAARHYLSYDATIRGLQFMANDLEATRDFVDLIDLSRTDAFDHVLDAEKGDGYSEGNGSELGDREERPLFLVRVTAPENAQLLEDVAPVPMADRDHFVWSMSAHGIEAAGREGGFRAIEDLATWASLEPSRRLLETEGDVIVTEGGRETENLRAGEVAMRSISYFMISNPDGWQRGDVDQGNSAFQRFNGNGMDLNRDWPEFGYVDPTFTPWSETESRSYGKALLEITDDWTGGIDLHGMVEANAFSYSLIGGSQRPYDKNERTMEYLEQAWKDAEQRLAWSPIIKPNDAPEQCVEFAGVTPNGDTHLPPGEDCDMRSYGVQYGTIWDTIEYTATGAIGNWFDSPIGLDADGIDNEMMLSHLGNCGIGTCYVPEAEQLHVDGNKGLIYSMINFELEPIEGRFDLDGTNVGYLVNPRRLVDPGVTIRQAPADAVDLPDLSGTVMTSLGQAVLGQLTVDNDRDGLDAAGNPLTTPAVPGSYVAGISASVRFQNLRSQSVHVGSINVQYQNPETGNWDEREGYGSDGAVYRVAGDHNDWNFPQDGQYRIVASTVQPMRISYEVEISTEPVFEDPIQAAYDASNMDFFTELAPFLAEGTTLTALNVDDVLSGARDLADFDTVVAADGALLPGYLGGGFDTTQGQLDLPRTGYTSGDAAAMGTILTTFAGNGGNVVLTDDAMQGLVWMGLVEEGDLVRARDYAGGAVFSNGYDHGLAADVNAPGAAEGAGGRRQTVEPIPLGYSIKERSTRTMPVWGVALGAVADAGGTSAAVAKEATGHSVLAEFPVGAGVVRAFGAALTFPTTGYHHPFGVADYGLTDHGYTILDNAMTWSNGTQNSAPNLADDDIQWIGSGIPTRIMRDGTSNLPVSFIE